MLDPNRFVPLRHRFIRAVRGWFDKQGFFEVETPIAVVSPGMEPHLRAFSAHSVETPSQFHHLYLHTSPEYHMKRLLASFTQPVFQICKCFRDEPLSTLHHPEFTMLEWYRPQSDYRELMKDCERLLEHLAAALLDGEPCLKLPGGNVVLSAPFERVTVRDAFLRFSRVDPLRQKTTKQLAQAAIEMGFEIPHHWTWEDIFHYIFIDRVEKHLGVDRPTILYEYPRRLASLSKVVGDVAQRFELFINGTELANAFTELTDSVEQRRRFVQETAERQKLGRPVYPIDEHLLEALDRLPPTSGIALGIDRLWLIFAQHLAGRSLHLQDVIFSAFGNTGGKSST